MLIHTILISRRAVSFTLLLIVTVRHTSIYLRTAFKAAKKYLDYYELHKVIQIMTFFYEIVFIIILYIILVNGTRCKADTNKIRSNSYFSLQQLII